MRIIASLICALMLLASGHAFASQVTSVALQYQDGSVVAHINIKGQVRFTHQTVEAKDGKPFRVIVDVLTATHNLPMKNFTSLPKCPVQQIRSSQYSIKPEKIVRVVFDMEEATFYRVESDNESISLFFPDKLRRKFTNWSSDSSTPAPGVINKATGDESIQPEKVALIAQDNESGKSVAELNKAIDKDRLLSLAGKPASEITATESSKKKTASTVNEPESASTKKLSTENSSRPNVTRKAPVIVADVPFGPEVDMTLLEPPTEPLADAPTTKKSETDKRSTPDMEKPSMKKPGAVSFKKDVVTSKELAVASLSTGTTATTQVGVKSASGTEQQKPATSSKKMTQGKPNKDNVIKTSKQKKVASSEPTVAMKPEAKVTSQKALPPVDKKPAPTKPIAVVDQSGQTLASKNNQDKQGPVKKSAPNKAKVVPNKDKKETKESLDSTATMKEEKGSGKKAPTSRFRRSPTRPTKIKGTLVAEFPKRLVIKYKQRNSRDPFETLINETKKYNNPIEGRIPNVEVLKLVGVLESDTGANSALFEDNDGYGYILKEGDKVRKGYVLRVENDRVYFQIFEYGWSRTVALNIDED